MPTQQVEERRAHPRLEFNRLVIVKDESGNTNSLLGVNYSIRGMALNSKTPLTFGEFVDLHFWLIEPETKEVNITAEVMHNSKEGGIYLTSLKFVGELALN